MLSQLLFAVLTLVPLELEDLVCVRGYAMDLLSCRRPARLYIGAEGFFGFYDPTTSLRAQMRRPAEQVKDRVKHARRAAERDVVNGRSVLGFVAVVIPVSITAPELKAFTDQDGVRVSRQEWAEGL